jgi:ferredoxin
MPFHSKLKNYAAQLGYGQSETMARIFEILYDSEEVINLVAALPGTAPEVAEKSGLSVNQVVEIGTGLIMRGRIIVDFKKNNVFRRFPAMIELRDSSVLDPETTQELYELWDRIVREESTDMVNTLRERQVAPMVRVIPIERSAEAQNQVLDIDSARKIFQSANLITVMPCVCRTIARKNGRSPDCPAPEAALCMQTNFFATGVLMRKVGQRISQAEALKRIGDAEDAGLVHMVRNNVQKDMFMCNCCSCCCTGLHMYHQYRFPGIVAPSRFRIKLNEDLCTACGVCADRCQFHAIAVGDDHAVIDLNHCLGCGNCAITCPEQALVLEEIRPVEHIRAK